MDWIFRVSDLELTVHLYICEKNIFAGATEFLKDITVGHGYHWKRDTSIINIVKQAPSIGCHLFDTSSAYGQSERVLGHCLKEYSRNEYFLVTKLSNQSNEKVMFDRLFYIV